MYYFIKLCRKRQSHYLYKTYILLLMTLLGISHYRTRYNKRVVSLIQKNVTIKNKYNKNLSAIIEVPKEDAKDFIIISHCFTCSKIYKLYNNISKTLVENGYGVVRYDVMGLGDSEGDFSDTSFTTNVEDLITVYDYISENYSKPSYLFGHSLGSLVSIKVANMLDGIKGVVTVGSPYNFDNLIRLFSNYEEELIEKDNMVVNLLGRNINIGLDYLKDLRGESVDEIINNFKKSIIIFHSNSDRIVPYEHGLKLFNLINSEKSFISLNNVDHLVANKEDAKYIGDIIYTWLEQFKYKL